ncbi:hypothetical protein K1719_018905 [Acacia pycnantha]|nr:hypothetical protein K1719_018905 [Acacia pycnantha]
MERKSLVFVCSILVLLLAQEVVLKTEALCDRPSRFYRGRCDNRRCNVVCRTSDRAIRGRCRGTRSSRRSGGEDGGEDMRQAKRFLQRTMHWNDRGQTVQLSLCQRRTFTQWRLQRPQVHLLLCLSL